MTPASLCVLRPADTLNLAFLVFLSLLTVASFPSLGSPLGLLFFFGLLMIVQVILSRHENRNRVVAIMYNLVLPTVSILTIYESLGTLVRVLNPRDVDAVLIRLDYILFRGYPTVMLEAYMSPLLADILHAAYATYYFLPLVLGIVLLSAGKEREFDQALFLIMLCFYLSYVGYLLMPAVGPRFTIAHLQTTEVDGILLTGPIRRLLDSLEGLKRDAFPSGHTAVALTVLVLAFRFNRRLFAIFLPAVSLLLVSTVACRYHYGIDVLAGIGLTLITIILGDTYYGYWSQRVYSHRRG